MGYVLLIVGFFVAGMTASEAAVAPEHGGGANSAAIGYIDNVVGVAHVIRADGAEEPLTGGLPLRQGDSLRTGDGAGLGVELADSTVIAMGGNGDLVIDEFVFDSAARQGSISISVAQGVVVMVSGLIAKTDPDAMTVATPTATIGVRGTQFGMIIDDLGRMTVVLMAEADDFVGEIVVRNGAGVAVMNGAHQATSIPFFNAPPVPAASIGPPQIRIRFGSALRHLPRHGNSANPY